MFIIETLSAFGMFLLLYLVLPVLDVSNGVFIMCAIAFVPSLLSSFAKKQSILIRILDVIACVAQFTPIFSVIWMLRANDEGNITTNDINEVCATNYSQPPYHNDDDFYDENSTLSPPPVTWTFPYDNNLPHDNLKEAILLPVAIFLISLGYWENFVDETTSSLFSLTKLLRHVKKNIKKSQAKIYVFSSLWKILLTFTLLVMYHGWVSPIDLEDTLLNSDHFYNNNETCGGYDPETVDTFYSDWLEVVVIQIIMGVVCFLVADMAIQTQLQIVGFTIPLVLASPFALLLFVWACEDCSSWDFGTEYYWNCFSGYNDYKDVFTGNHVYVGFFWWISLLWVTRYLWTPKNERLVMVDR